VGKSPRESPTAASPSCRGSPLGVIAELGTDRLVNQRPLRVADREAQRRGRQSGGRSPRSGACLRQHRAQTGTECHLSASEVVDLAAGCGTSGRDLLSPRGHPGRTAPGVPTRAGYAATARSRAARALPQRVVAAARVEPELGVQAGSAAYGSRPSGRLVRTVATGGAHRRRAPPLPRSWALWCRIPSAVVAPGRRGLALGRRGQGQELPPVANRDLAR
jgi:hypothetical protein